MAAPPSVFVEHVDVTTLGVPPAAVRAWHLWTEEEEDDDASLPPRVDLLIPLAWVQAYADVLQNQCADARWSVSLLGDAALIEAWRAASYVMHTDVEAVLTEEVARRLLGAATHIVQGPGTERQAALARWRVWTATWPGMLFAYTRTLVHRTNPLAARLWDTVALHTPATAVEAPPRGDGRNGTQ